MTPHYSDDWLTIYGGDCREVLASLPSNSVDCVVTSPPYWGLRDYGSEGQLGLERTPDEYVANMVAVFAEVRRVLKPSGTCWLNLGDSFGSKQLVGVPWRVAFALQADGWYLRSDIIWSKPNPMPESVTDRPTKAHEYLFLLTKSARYYFDADAVRETFADYNGGSEFYVRRGEEWSRTKRSDDPRDAGTGNGIDTFSREGRAGRNIRSVWTIATRPYPGAHFAVFPPELPERCMKAGSSERGVCPECGAPWERMRSQTGTYHAGTGGPQTREGKSQPNINGRMRPPTELGVWETTGWRPTCDCLAETGSRDDSAGDVPDVQGGPIQRMPGRTASNGNGPPYDSGLINRAESGFVIPGVILDPFAGSGTVGMVANRLSRRAILIDLNPEYLRQQMTRNAQTPLGLGA